MSKGHQSIMQSVQREGCWIYWLWSVQIKHILRDFLVYMILEEPILITVLRPSDSKSDYKNDSDIPNCLEFEVTLETKYILRLSMTFKLPKKWFQDFPGPSWKTYLFPWFSRLHEPCISFQRQINEPLLSFIATTNDSYSGWIFSVRMNVIWWLKYIKKMKLFDNW